MNQLVVENLSVTLGQGAARRRVVQNISFTLEPGKVVALVGESGSGKSVTARALVGLAGSGVTAQRLSFGNHDLLRLPERQWRKLRGKDIGFVLQDALVSLDPLRPVGQEVLEALATHHWGNRRQRRARVLELLALAGIVDPALRARQRPDELSGGLRQRALIATALALDPAIVIADEPTTALDTTVQAQILDLFRTIKARGTGLLLISHDLAIVSQLADEVLVLNHGEVLEQGPTQKVLTKPQHPYTRSLANAVPGTHPRGTRLSTGTTATRAPPRPAEIVLQAENICKNYAGPDGKIRRAVDHVSFTLKSGQTLGIVGESGSGKTTAARIALGMLAPDAGQISFNGAAWAGIDVPELQRRPHRRNLAIIYQDALGSFDPRWSIRQILSDALDAAGVPRPLHGEQIAEMLHKVRLPQDIAKRHPLQLSGGQRQRVAIARAIAGRPKLIICDEPVSALDVSVQAQVLDLLADLQAELGIAYLFISHDLGVIRHVSDEVLVMQDGKAVEQGETEAVFNHPQHEFTRRLLAATPR